MKLKGGYTTEDRRLDRLPEFDERSREFPIRTLIADVPLRPRRWRLVERLDQGREGACVGFGFAHELAATPVRVPMTNEKAQGIYRRAQQLDQWPGENYDGTSVLAGAKAVKEFGRIDSYRWAFSVHDVLSTLSLFGPVVIGVPWFEGMFSPDAYGFLHVEGQVAGGHCVCLRGVERDRNGWYVILRNSWSRSWGVGGDAKIRAVDLGRLLEEDGEACVPIGRR